MAHSIADDHTNPTQQRTVLLATDNKNSVLAEVGAGKTNYIAYSAYGHQSAQQDVTTRLGFNGELREAQIGWYLLGNGYRAYNPRLMRFHSPDSLSPFGAGGLNAYMYCGGEPVMNKDPTGHALVFASLLDDVLKNVQTMIAQGSTTSKSFKQGLAGRFSSKMNNSPYDWPNKPPLKPGPSSAPYPAIPSESLPKPPVSKMNNSPYDWPNKPPLKPGPSSAPYPAIPPGSLPKPPVSKMNNSPYDWPNKPPLKPGPSSAPYPAIPPESLPKPPVSKMNPLSKFSSDIRNNLNSLSEWVSPRNPML